MISRSEDYVNFLTRFGVTHTSDMICTALTWGPGNGNAVGFQARNAIFLRSYSMAPWKMSKLLSAVVDKGHRFFGNRSTQRLPGDLHSAMNPIASPSTTSQKIFKKSNDARRDMSVLAMAYILRDCTTIRELILLIISLNDHDNSGKVCTTCMITSSG